MVTKIFDQLKQEYAHLGLSDEVIQGQAKAIAVFATNENLNDIVKGQKDVLEGLQKTLDRRVTQAIESYKRKNTKAEPKSQSDYSPNMPEWAKRVTEYQKRRIEKQEREFLITLNSEQTLSDCSIIFLDSLGKIVLVKTLNQFDPSNIIQKKWYRDLSI